MTPWVMKTGREAHYERKREMRKDLPHFLRDVVIRGFEDDDKDKKESKESEDTEGDDDDDDEGSDNKPDNNDALKSALQKERADRKRLAREAKALKARLDAIEDKEKSDTDKAKDLSSKSAAQVQKLAEKLRTTAVDTAIERVAAQLKFQDPDDAVTLVDRSLIEVDQDDDDPAEIDLSMDSVKAAVEALAKKKPHLLLKEETKDKSGSKFNGPKKTPKETDDEALRKLYPALNRSGLNS